MFLNPFLLSTALFYVIFEEIWEDEEGKGPKLKVYYAYKTKDGYKNYVLGALKNCDYSRAKMLAEDLSDEGEFGFLKMLLLNYFVGINLIMKIFIMNIMNGIKRLKNIFVKL
jgi:hypothetical protein